jgi:hypothetical protein
MLKTSTWDSGGWKTRGDCVGGGTGEHRPIPPDHGAQSRKGWPLY